LRLRNARGEFLTLPAPSGSGKSTLLSVRAGFPVFSSYDKQNENRAEPSMVPGTEWKAESSNIYEIGNRLLGRAFASVGKSRSAIEPRTDPRPL
jgi:energy-coupling factor transporter ATP-binding protein EcfA2